MSCWRCLENVWKASSLFLDNSVHNPAASSSDSFGVGVQLQKRFQGSFRWTPCSKHQGSGTVGICLLNIHLSTREQWCQVWSSITSGNQESGKLRTGKREQKCESQEFNRGWKKSMWACLLCCKVYEFWKCQCLAHADVDIDCKPTIYSVRTNSTKTQGLIQNES